MKSWILATFASIAVFLSFAPADATVQPKAAATLPPTARDLEAYLDQTVLAAMAEDHVAGAAVSVVQGGEVLAERGYGRARLNPSRRVTPDRTLFHIGSVAKTFTWILVMRAVEQGRLSLDAPVNTYLPKDAQIPSGRFKTPITLRHLMSHSSGFSDPELGVIFEIEPKSVKPLAEFVKRERPPRFQEPGRFAAYSDYGATLAGYIAAKAMGLDYETLVERDILAPLGMRNTSFRDARPSIPGLAAPLPRSLAAQTSEEFIWEKDRFKSIPIELTGPTVPSGGGWTTASDMSRYMLMLLRDGQYGRARIFGPVSARAFRTPILKTADGVNGWAHGFMQLNAPGARKAFGHDGNTMAFCSNMVLIPELDMGIFVVVNTDAGAGLCQTLPDKVVSRFYPSNADPVTKTIPPNRELLSRYVGYYNATRRAPYGVEDYLDFSNPRRVRFAEGGIKALSRTWLPTSDPSLFVEKDGSGRLSFDLVEGKPVRWRTESNTTQFERTTAWSSRKWDDHIFYLVVFVALAAVVTWRIPTSDNETRRQAQLRLLQAVTATLWLVSLGAYFLFVPIMNDGVQMMYHWPHPLLSVFSWVGLVAAILTAAQVAGLGSLWSGAGRIWRRIHYSGTALFLAAFACFLAVRGAIAAWTL